MSWMSIAISPASQQFVRQSIRRRIAPELWTGSLILGMHAGKIMACSEFIFPSLTLTSSAMNILMEGRPTSPFGALYSGGVLLTTAS